MAQPPPSAYRFYNAALRAQYDACPLQVSTATTVPKAHHFHGRDARNCDDARSGFVQRDRRPRPNATHLGPPTPRTVKQLAQPFRRPVDCSPGFRPR